MDAFKIGVCEPDLFSEKAIHILENIGSVELYNADNGQIEDFVADKNAIFVRLKHKINNDLLAKAERLEYICSPTTGLNHIDLDGHYKIVSLKGEYDFLSTIRATPEHTFGLSLALLRNYKGAFLHENSCDWNRNKYRGYELYCNSVGIIGLGRVGNIIAGYYSKFGAKVFYYDVCDKNSDIYTKCDSVFDLIDKSNIIVLEANYNDNNIKMIGKEVLERMKGKYFINTARGELVDEDALIELIQEDYFAGVAIDVLTDETSSNNNLKKLVSLEKNHNIIITPHIGGATFTSMRRTEEFIAEKLVEIVQFEKKNC